MKIMGIFKRIQSYFMSFIFKIDLFCESVFHSSQKRRFELNFLFWQNALKFAIIIEKEDLCSFFILRCENIDQDNYKVKISYLKIKNKKLSRFPKETFFYINGKFWSSLLEQKLSSNTFFLKSNLIELNFIGCMSLLIHFYLFISKFRCIFDK